VPRWSLRLLGPFSLERDGIPLGGFRSDKVRALLAYLASESGRPWTRSLLADLLWPDRPEPVARANLRNALSNLRHVLEDGRAVPAYLEVSSTEVRVNGAADHWVDVAALHDLLDPTPGDRFDDEAGTVDRLERALALIRGDFLEGLSLDSGPFAAWSATVRDHWRVVTARTARTLALAYARRGEPGPAETATRRWLNLEPWDESAHRHLMRLLARQGQRAAALAQVETCRRALAEELGVEPEAETMHLAAAIQAGEVGVEPTAAVAVWPGLATPPVTEAHVFVAREPELAALEAALRRVGAEGVGAMFVVGEAGSGKTELLAEFARRALADDPGLLVLWGHCSSFTGQGDPFEPFVHVARMLSGEAEAPPQAPPHRAVQARRAWQRLPDTVDAFLERGPDLLGRFVSARSLQGFARHHAGVDEDRLARLGSRVERVRPPPSSRSGSPSALVEQFTAVLRQLARRQSMLLLLDDLQWIDSASVDLLFHLARGLEAARVLIVGAYRSENVGDEKADRPHPLAAAAGELLSAGRAGLLDLSNVADGAFVDAVLDSEPNALGAPFRTELAARTGGHALFTVELLRGMQARGDLQRDRDGLWVEGPTLRWDELPTRVEAAIANRIGHLSPACVAALEVASVEGEQFTCEVVAAITDRPVTATCELLSHEAGRRHRLVVAHGVRPLDEGDVALYGFRHGLFQSYLLQRLDAIERARLHGRVGRELERLYRRSLERYPQMHHTLARHFDAAGMAAEAVVHYQAAASHAQRLSAYRAGIAHRRRALELLATEPASPDRDARELQLQLVLGTALTEAQGWSHPEVAAAYARARELCESVQDDALVVTGLWHLYVFHIGHSEHPQAEVLRERLARLADRTGDPLLHALAQLDVTSFYLGRFETARRRLEAASTAPGLAQQRALAARFGIAPAVVSLAYLAECLWLLDRPGEADGRGRQALELAEAVDHPITSCHAYSRACWWAALRGDRDVAGAMAEALLGIALAHELGNFSEIGTFFAEYASPDGAPSLRLERMHDAIERYRQGGATLLRAAFLTHFARACGEVGQHRRGLAAVDAALAESARSGERWLDAETWRTKAALLRPDRARPRPCRLGTATTVTGANERCAPAWPRPSRWRERRGPSRWCAAPRPTPPGTEPPNGRSARDQGPPPMCVS
jgi:DNA-binding SARP family transcriptional activator